MSWIEQIEPGQADGELHTVYDELTRRRGKVANILKVHSLRPAALRAQDVATLRETGFTDADVLLADLIVAYFNFVNRVALGLGVDFDADETRGYAADRSAADRSVERP